METRYIAVYAGDISEEDGSCGKGTIARIETVLRRHCKAYKPTRFIIVMGAGVHPDFLSAPPFSHLMYYYFCSNLKALGYSEDVYLKENGIVISIFNAQQKKHEIIVICSDETDWGLISETRTIVNILDRHEDAGEVSIIAFKEDERSIKEIWNEFPRYRIKSSSVHWFFTNFLATIARRITAIRFKLMRTFGNKEDNNKKTA